MTIRELLKNRLNILIIFAVVLASILIFKLVDLQIVRGEYYTQIADKRMYKTVDVKAQRGDITDRYGSPLATNKAAYSVMINDQFKTPKELNDTLYNLIKVIEDNGLKYDDNLPVSYENPYSFRFDQIVGMSVNEEKWKSNIELSHDATPQQAIEKLTQLYEIDTSYGQDMVRKIIGLRYDMKSRNFGSRNPFLFINDIDITLVSKIKENPQELTGIEIISEPVRYYPNKGIGAHILGQVGIIYQEEYNTLKDKGYGMNDILGKDGLEKYLEYYLRGKNGKDSVELNINGENLVLSDNEQAQPGNRAILTIDANMQSVAEKALEDAVKNMYQSGAKEVGGAAAVAIEINSGEVLALANYPTYNPASFKQDYSKLLSDPDKPMFNRAISGAYPPGSTFKPLTAITGLQERAVTRDELINCDGRYDVYAPSYRPACWIWNDYGGKHGYISIVKALEVSCNIYFFETGRRVGINKLNEYGKAFGLGELTGIELSGETSGVLAGPAYRESMGGTWYPGDTIQAAIGQSDNLFTPIQMANYAATIANGGTRYAPHLVKDIVKYDGSKTIVSFEPKVLNKIDILPENLKTVHEGMRAVVEEGSSKNTFKDAKFEAAGKTGTAQIRLDKTPHSWFITYAPYENPQVAIAVMVEYGGINGLGGYVSGVARKMYESYFYSNEKEAPPVKNSLLR